MRKPKRKIIIQGDIAIITLTRGFISIIDVADVHVVEAYNWYSLESAAGMRAARYNGKDKMMLMHRQIMNAPDYLLVDHKDGDMLNNRRLNLRMATHKQNCHNSRAHRGKTSDLKGASLYAKRGKWVSSITKPDGTVEFLGIFMTDIEAHTAYRKAAEKYHGDFASFLGVERVSRA